MRDQVEALLVPGMTMEALAQAYAQLAPSLLTDHHLDFTTPRTLNKGLGVFGHKFVRRSRNCIRTYVLQ